MATTRDRFMVWRQRYGHHPEKVKHHRSRNAAMTTAGSVIRGNRKTNDTYMVWIEDRFTTERFTRIGITIQGELLTLIKEAHNTAAAERLTTARMRVGTAGRV